MIIDYIYSCFEALHTTGANNIVEDIDLYIQARQPAKSQHGTKGSGEGHSSGGDAEGDGEAQNLRVCIPIP